MGFFLSYFFGIQTEALRATVIGFPNECMTAIKAFHVRVFSDLLFAIDICNDFFGVEAVAFRAPTAYLVLGHVPTGEALYPIPVAPADLILGIVAQERVGTDRVGNVHRSKPAFSALFRNGLISV